MPRSVFLLKNRSDVQRRVITLIHRVGDIGNTDAVSDLPHPGGTVPKRHHSIPVGTLTHSADHGFAGNQNLFPLRVTADKAILRYTQTRMA